MVMAPRHTGTLDNLVVPRGDTPTRTLKFLYVNSQDFSTGLGRTDEYSP
jgi:hypothetical protein